jgi:hypothetical protein
MGTSGLLHTFRTETLLMDDNTRHAFIAHTAKQQRQQRHESWHKRAGPTSHSRRREGAHVHTPLRLHPTTATTPPTTTTRVDDRSTTSTGPNKSSSNTGIRRAFIGAEETARLLAQSRQSRPLRHCWLWLKALSFNTTAFVNTGASVIHPAPPHFY